MALDPASLKTLALEIAASMPPPPPPPAQHATDVSPRGIKIARIERIARRYEWPDAIPHFLQTRGVPYITDLTEPQLDDLLSRMEGYVDAAETGCSLDDCLPAT